MKKPDRSPKSRRDHQGSEDFLGLDIEGMSPRAQVTASLTVLIPAVVGVVLVLSLASWLWWLIFVFGWVIFPAFSLLVRGIAGLLEGKSELASASGKERELLEALREHGELSPAQVAMETSLTVAEADRMLKELAEGGHLQVRVRGGGLLYSLWEVEGGEETRLLEGR